MNSIPNVYQTAMRNAQPMIDRPTQLHLRTDIAVNLLNKLAERAIAVAYNPSWANDTGYFNGATKHKTQDVLKSVDPTGREIYIIPVAGQSNIVIFRRYAESQRTWAVQAPMAILHPENTYGVEHKLSASGLFQEHLGKLASYLN